MKGKRSKQYRKLMHQYQLTFGFREPYQVLLTSDIILAAHRYKMSLGSLLSNTLHGQIKPMISQCSIRYLYTMPASQEKDACVAVAKEAERRRCGHHELDEPLSELECVTSVVDGKGSGTNKHKYIVATQEKEIRSKMRDVIGVPLIYINRSVMILEPMAEPSVKVKEGEEKAKIRAGLKPTRRTTGEKRKREDGEGDDENNVESRDAGQSQQSVQKKRKLKGPSGPNPLSVQKSKKEAPKQKSAGRQAEDDRAMLRNMAKTDPQAREKALGADGATNGIAEGQHKRKRKRKPKDVAAGAETVASAAGEGD